MMRIPPWLKAIFDEPVYQVATLVFVFEIFFIPRSSNFGDSWAFFSWAKFISENGVGNMYKIADPVCNYPPLIGYPLFIFARIEDNVQNLEHYFYFYKAFGLLADFIAAITLVSILGDKKREVVLLLLLIANPVFIFNSYCWGQVDGVLAMLVFTSFVLLLKQRLIWSVVAFTLAINFKTHAIIFLPPLVLFTFTVMNRKLVWKDIFTTIIAFGTTQTLILIPFIAAGQLPAVVKSVTGSVDFYRCVSCFAFNLWALILGADTALKEADSNTFFIITYKQTGVLLFCTFSAVALFPMFISSLARIYKKINYRISTSDTFLTFALIPLLFFFLNTQMHERFGHTTLIFTAAFAFATRKYWIFAIMCLAYFGNMEHILKFFNFPNYGVLIFQAYWVASLYLICIVFLLFYLYRSFISQLRSNTYERTIQS